MSNFCYVILMSSGLDSTASIIKLINLRNLKNSTLIPIYIWWRNNFTRVLDKELSNCKLIIQFIREKYKNKNLNLQNLIKIEIPLIFYENIRQELIDNNKEYWCYLRNGIFIMSSVNYILNYLKLKDLVDFKKIIFVTGFVGHKGDENREFLRNIKWLINRSLNDNDYISYLPKLSFFSPYLRIHKLDKSAKAYYDLSKYDCQDILQYTWSCWRNSDKSCMNCGGCLTRIRKYKTYKKTVNKNSIIRDPILE